MAISNGNKITAADINAVINGVQTTYKKYGFSSTTSTVTANNIAKLSEINTAINKLNSSISDSANRRYYYYKGGAVGKVTAGTILSAAKISEISTTNTAVANDYCNCDTDCCDSYCYCDCDCCVGDCTCDSNCGCDRDACYTGCFQGGDYPDCSDCCVADCCDEDCCNNDCCDADCTCYSDCCESD